MSDVLFDGDDDANTPISPEERDQLIPSYVTLRSELNEAEAANIQNALAWLRRKRDFTSDAVLRETHRRMFNKVWRWAGSYRNTSRNIGVPAHQIATDILAAAADARFWLDNRTFSPDEIAIRYSHKLVSIHPFPNGNGRFSRMIADRMVIQMGQPAFSWGRTSLVTPSKTRQDYVSALRAADNFDINPLIVFARS
jgi:Fic-DOC domain mobile mystery protein B